MRLAILYPHFVHPAIEERYGSWQSQLFLRRAVREADWVTYQPDEAIGTVASRLEADHCLVVTDPLLLVGASIAACLSAALSAAMAAALPVTNAASQDAQLFQNPEPYLTIRQFQEVAEARAAGDEAPRVVTWNGDPGIYLCSTAFLRSAHGTALQALDG